MLQVLNLGLRGKSMLNFNIDKKKLEHYQNHGKPVTRRDFLSLGILGYASFSAFSPQLFALEQIRKFKTLDDQLPGFIVLDLAGGAGLPANFLVGKQEGPKDYLKSYSQLGWNPRVEGHDDQFGVPMAKESGHIYKAMMKHLSPEAAKFLKFGSLIHAAQDDSSANPLSALSLVMNMNQHVGSVLNKSIGTMDSSSGGNSSFTFPSSKFKPQVVKSSKDLNLSIGLGDVFNSLDKVQKELIVHKFNQLNSLQAKKILNEEELKKVKKVHALYKDQALVDLDMDARVDPILQKIYGISSSTSVVDINAKFSTIAKGVLNSLTGPAVMTIGGCDYHDNTMETGDKKDFEIGEQLGRLFEYSYQIKKPVFVQMITDGGVYSRENSRVWAGDSGDKCMSIIAYMNPNKEPEYIDKKKVQVGHYTDGQGVERKSLIGNSPALASYSVFANYLNICNQLHRFDEFSGSMNPIFTKEELESVLIFKS